MFVEIVNESTELASTLIGLDQKLLDSSLFGLFKFKDYKAISNNLIDIKAALENLSKKTLASSDSSFHALKQHLKNLLVFCDCLILICDGLERKSKGYGYSASFFRGNIEDLERAKNACTTSQRELFISYPKLSQDNINEINEILEFEIDENILDQNIWYASYGEANGIKEQAIACYFKNRSNLIKQLVTTPFAGVYDWSCNTFYDTMSNGRYSTNLYYEKGNGNLVILFLGKLIEVNFEFVNAGETVDERINAFGNIVYQKTFLPVKNEDCEKLLIKVAEIFKKKLT